MKLQDRSFDESQNDPIGTYRDDVVADLQQLSFATTILCYRTSANSLRASVSSAVELILTAEETGERELRHCRQVSPESEARY